MMQQVSSFKKTFESSRWAEIDLYTVIYCVFYYFTVILPIAVLFIIYLMFFCCTQVHLAVSVRRARRICQAHQANRATLV